MAIKWISNLQTEVLLLLFLKISRFEEETEKKCPNTASQIDSHTHTH